MLAGDFFVVEVGDGGAVVDPAQPVHGAGGEEHGRDELGLAASAVADEGHVADGGGVVDLHRGIPPAPRSAKRRRDSASATPTDERPQAEADHNRPVRRGPQGDGDRQISMCHVVHRQTMSYDFTCFRRRRPAAPVGSAAHAPALVTPTVLIVEI